MQTIPPTSRILPQQTRVIHASQGMRLHVLKGRLWLTQPCAMQDLFLGPGAEVELTQDWVVISADFHPSASLCDVFCEYQISPLLEPDSSRFWRRR